MSNDALQTMAQGILERQPFSIGLGTEIVSISEGKVEMTLPITPALTQHLGMVHGGVVAALADMGIGYAGGPILGEGSVTSEFKINYLRPGVGERLTVRANVLSAGKSQAVVRADVYVLKDGTEKLCAAAQGTMTRASAPKD